MLLLLLLDFAVVGRHRDHADVDDADVCHVYARIRQLPPPPRVVSGNEVESGGRSGEVTVCAGRVRERPVFVSDTERVEVTIVTAASRTNDEDPAYFLLRYSGFALYLTNAAALFGFRSMFF